MTKRVERAAPAAPAPRLLLLTALALLFALGQPRPAMGQQPWSTPDASNNIHSTNSGNVGIGTTSPDKLLTVQGSVPFLGAMTVVRTTGSNNGFGLLLDAAGTGNNNYGFAVGGMSKGALGWDVSRGFIGFANFGYNSGNDFSLRINSDGSLTYHDGATYPAPERFRITAAGNVGIGTATPAKALDVIGDMRATGTITGGNIVAKYQDVAEWVPADRALPAGTVVVLDTQAQNRVTASSQAYDTKVAGVVSETPGIVLGEAGDGKVKVATTGRVRIKVDATRAPIKIGDLLVTSDVAGVAMKSVPLDFGGTPIHRPGTIIGKALESLEKGMGEITVLLSLQ
jgi:hypothetical protein